MFKILFTTTFLIVLVVFVRFVCKNHISARLQYALWFFVAVKLLVFPIPNVEGSFSVWGLVAQMENNGLLKEDTPAAEFSAKGESMSAEDTQQEEAATSGNLWGDGQAMGEASAETDTAESPEAAKKARSSLPVFLKWRQRINLRLRYYRENVLKMPGWLMGIWGAGYLLCAAYMAAYHIRLRRYLRENRVEINRPVKTSLAVYSVTGLPTPCLFGRNVYVPQRLAEDTTLLPYILKHEMCHYFHGDFIWGAVRMLCVCLYWYHPLVWLAAYLSRQDCELACDEAVVRRMDGQGRKSYGELLLQFAPVKNSPADCFSMTTAMSGNAKNLRQRLERIAGKKKNRALLGVCAAALTSAGIFACITSGFVSPGKQWQFIQIKPQEGNVPFLQESYELSYRLSKDAASYGLYAEQYEYGELVSVQAWDCESLSAEKRPEKEVKRGTANIYRTIETEETTGACLKIDVSYTVTDYAEADGPTSLFKAFSLELPENCAGNSFSFNDRETLRHRFRLNEDIILAADYYGDGSGEEMPDGTTVYGHLQVPPGHVFAAADYREGSAEILKNDRCVMLLHLIVSDRSAEELKKQMEDIVKKKTEGGSGSFGESTEPSGDETSREEEGGGGYSNGELLQMAENFYRREHGFAPAHVELDSENGNEVVIWLYDNDEFLNADNEIVGSAHTGDWYTVDRRTGKGENVLSEEIDLTQTVSLTRPWGGKIEEMTIEDVREDTAFFALPAEPETGAERRLYLLGETGHYSLYGAGDYRSMILEEQNTLTEILVPFITDGITLQPPGVQEADYDGDGEAELAVKLLWGEGTGVWKEQLWMLDKEAGQIKAYEYQSGAYAEELLRKLSFAERENGNYIALNGQQISPVLREEQGVSYEETGINTSRVSFAFADGTIKLRTLLSCGSREGSVMPAYGDGCLEAEILYKGSRTEAEGLSQGGSRFSIGDVASADLKDVEKLAEEAVRAFYAPREIKIIKSACNMEKWSLSEEAGERMEMTLTVLEDGEDSYDFATAAFVREEMGQWSAAGEIWIEK